LWEAQGHEKRKNTKEDSSSEFDAMKEPRKNYPPEQNHGGVGTEEANKRGKKITHQWVGGGETTQPNRRAPKPLDGTGAFIGARVGRRGTPAEKHRGSGGTSGRQVGGTAQKKKWDQSGGPRGGNTYRGADHTWMCNFRGTDTSRGGWG